MSHSEDLPEVQGYEPWHVYVSAIVGVVATVLAIWWASGFARFYETLFRVNPVATGPNRGIGADWVAGNTIPALDFLIALVHAADVIMGMFILVMVFLHWAAFRRLANRMRQPGEGPAEAVAADGGTDTEARTDGGQTPQGERPDDDRGTDETAGPSGGASE